MTQAQREYVFGSAARRQYELPERYYDDIYEEARRNNIRPEKESQAAPVSTWAFVLLTVALLAIIALCVNYLSVQSRITARVKNIEAQEKILEQYKNDNDALEARIDASINLDDIYRVATEELGMVYADKNQVVTYDKTPTEYVRQNENITD